MRALVLDETLNYSATTLSSSSSTSITMARFSAILLLAFVAHTCRGYPTGAPVSVCDSMMPGHGVGPQTATSPFSVSATFSPDDGNVVVTLGSDEEREFKGFMLQARPASGGHAIGAFQVTDPSVAKTQNCGSGTDNSVTHVGKEDKTKVQVTWTPPEGFSGDVIFKATFVQSFLVFWTDVNSQIISL